MAEVSDLDLESCMIDGSRQSVIKDRYWKNWSKGASGGQ